MHKIFSFHRVSSINDPFWPPVKPELFEFIIKHLKKHTTIINLEDYLNNLNEYKNVRHTSSIVFDDGYKDNFTEALPILQNYNVKASFYVVTNSIDTGIPPWTQLVMIFFSHREEIDFSNFELPEKFKRFKNNNLKDKIRSANQFKAYLKNISDEERNKIIDFIKSNLDLSFQDLMMNWEEIKTLHNLGHKIGSHTVNHNVLPTIQSNEKILYELEYSARRIKEEIGMFPEIISYPFGKYDNRVIELAKKAGYKWGLTVEQKFFNIDKENLFAIPRVELYDENKLKTLLRMNGLYEQMKGIFYIFKSIR